MNNQPLPSYYYPQKLQSTISAYNKRCQNLGLLLDKYIPARVIDKSSEKSNWLREIIQQTKDAPESQKLFQAAYNRWQAMVKMQSAEPFFAAVDWHLIVGNGGSTVLETDITLHHLYGFPTIPGSALKGLTRAYAEAETAPTPAPDAGQTKGEVENTILSEQEQQASKQEQVASKANNVHPDITRIFGSQQKAGTVIFFDAMPVNGRSKLIVDIINAHYPEYYRSLEGDSITPPRNDQNPNPVPFLTVTETHFAFALAPRKPEHQPDVEKAQQWLLKALSEYGIGGKTSAGYGYFQASNTDKKPDNQPANIVTQQPEPEPYIRPNMPTFNGGQGIIGSVITPNDELKRQAPQAKAFLKYREFSTKTVLIAIETEETLDWTQGQTKNCLFIREEEREGCTLLICQLGAAKKKKGKKS